MPDKVSSNGNRGAGNGPETELFTETQIPFFFLKKKKVFTGRTARNQYTNLIIHWQYSTDRFVNGATT